MKFNLDKKSQKSILSVVIVGLLLAVAILFWKKDSGKPAVEQARAETGAEKPGSKDGGHDEGEGLVEMDSRQVQAAGISVANAAPASIGNLVQLPGEVRFNEDRTAHIVPRLPGVAESVAADLGQHVKKGQVLAVISSPELAELRSASLAAQKRLGLAQLTYEREKKLWQDKISAEQDYLQAQQAYREAEIQFQTARSKLTALGAGDGEGTLNRYVLRAPFNGVVVEKHIAQGEAVKEDANVFLLSDLSNVWVEVVVTPKDLESARVGETATITSTATDSKATGKISYVGSLLGEQTRTAKARVVIDNPNMAWRPGLFVNVALERGKKDIPVAVQSEAIQTVEGKSVVFTKVARGFKVQTVTVGATDGHLVEIVEGLRAGTAYATKGSFVVKAQQGKGDAEHGH